MTMKHAKLFVILAAACAGHAAIGAEAAAPKAAPKAHAAPEQGQEVAYDDLTKYIGKRLIVHTKLNTTRSGTLLRHTASEIDLKLDTGAELSITHDTIKRVVVPVPAPDPLFKPSDPKNGDAKASDVKPAAAKPADAKPSDKTTTSKPADAKTSEDSAKKK
jgi:hypothetical protein